MVLPTPIASHEAELVALCRRHRVRRLEVFGSAAAGAFDVMSSDLDFLVEFQEIPLVERADAYFGLLADLEDLFGLPIDLVMTRAIRNPYFLKAIEGTRTTVYAA